MSDDKSEDEISDDLLHGWLQNQASRPLEDYMRRGRPFRHMETGIMKERWVEIFREMSNLDQTNRKELDDIEAEFEIRSEVIPYDAVESDIENFKKNISEEIERIERKDPDRFDEINRDIAIEVAEFVRQKRKPSA